MILTRIVLLTSCLLYLGLISVKAQDITGHPDTLSTQRDTADVNPHHPLLDSLRYRLIGDGNFTRGNVSRTLLVLRAELAASGPVLSLTSNPRFTFGKQSGILAERDAYIDIFVDLFKKEKTYFFALGILENSNLRKIHLRQNGGAGIGLNVARNNPHHTLNLTNAILYESTSFFERPDVTTIRNSLRMRGRHQFEKTKVKLDHTTFLQPSLANIHNFRWSTLLAVEIPMSRWFSLRSAFENSFESIVDAGRKRNDYRLTVGFVVGTL